MVGLFEYNFVSAFFKLSSWLTARHTFREMAVCIPTNSQQKLLKKIVHISGIGDTVFILHNFTYLIFFGQSY